MVGVSVWADIKMGEKRKKLAPGKWFTVRVSSCGLLHIAHPSAPDQLKGELRTIYGQLCQDDMPMVRRAAASNLMKFAATFEHNHLKTAIMSIFDDLTQDDAHPQTMPPLAMKHPILPIVSPSIKGGSPTSSVRRSLFTDQGTRKEPTDTQVAQTEEIANDSQSAEAVAQVASIPQSVGTKSLQIYIFN